MPMLIRRFMPVLTATAGGLLATAFLSSAVAHADDWTIGPATEVGYLPAAASAAASPADAIAFPIPGDPGYSVIPDPEDGPLTITSVTGFAPIYTTVEEQGSFDVNEIGTFGNASFYSDMFGDHNVLFERLYSGELAQVIDQFNFGSSGFENVYSDVVGGAPDGSNAITDTFMTPFGDFSIPTLYDAAAEIPTPLGAAALDTDFSGFVSALDADWTTLVTDFGALF